MSEISSIDTDVEFFKSMDWIQNKSTMRCEPREQATQKIYYSQPFLHQQQSEKTDLDSSKQHSIRLKNSRIDPRKTGGSVSGDITVSWGGKDGVKISGGASGEIHDDNGNYARGEVRQDSSGEGSATVSAGCKRDKK